MGLNGLAEPDHDLIGTEYIPASTNAHAHMTMQLWLNEDFRNYFLNRYADIMNTTFHPWNFTPVLQSVKANIAPEMLRQIQRWGGGGLNNFNHQLDVKVQGYIDTRPDFQRQFIRNYFDLDTSVNVTLDAYPPGTGTVQISTIVPDSLPWSGIYFKGNPVKITALAEPGYQFENWTANNVIDAGSLNDEELTLSLIHI